MKINIRADSVEIEGYVNAIERNSKTLRDRVGEFVERICKGAFKKALKRNDDVHILLNHDWNKDLGSTKQGNLELVEDNIGLRAIATITDKEVVEKAKRGDLVGWSFGFTDRDVENTIEHNMPTRIVKDLDLFEVSILDRRKSPAYEGTLIATRSETNDTYFIGDEMVDETNISIEEEKPVKMETESNDVDTRDDKTTETENDVSENTTDAPKNEEGPKQHDENVEKIQKVIDYSKYDNLIKEMKGEI